MPQKQRFSVVLAPGDGAAPAVFDACREVLAFIGSAEGYTIDFRDEVIGGCSIDRFGSPLNFQALDAARECDAILLGPVGGPKWSRLPPRKRPGEAILRLREELGLFANLRPAFSIQTLSAASPLRAEIVKTMDLLLVRELLGGLYRGSPSDRRTDNGMQIARDTQEYATKEIERIADLAFRLAQGRRGRLCSIDKESMLATGRLWREVVDGLRARFPDVELQHMHVDTFAGTVVREPGQFDVILADNMFGDIISDCLAGLLGLPLLLPTASLGRVKPSGRRQGLYEPMHVEAHADCIADPAGVLYSFALLLRHSLDLPGPADRLNRAVTAVIKDGLCTAGMIAGGPGRVLPDVEFCSGVLSRLKSDVDAVTAGRVGHA